MSQETSDSGPRSGPPRGPRRDGPSGGSGGSGGRYGGPPGLRRPRRKVCTFCVDKVQKIDYKDVGRIRRFISDRGKIDPRRKSGSIRGFQWIECDGRLSSEAAAPGRLTVEQLGARHRNE